MENRDDDKEYEAESLFEVDEQELKMSDRIPDFPELIKEIQKEAYVLGFHRAQDQAWHGLWDSEHREMLQSEISRELAEGQTGTIRKELANEIYESGFDEGRRAMARGMYGRGFQIHWITSISGESAETARRWLREELKIEEEKKRRDEEEKRYWELYEFKRNTTVNMYKYYGYSVEDIARITRIDIEKVRRWVGEFIEMNEKKKQEE